MIQEQVRLFILDSHAVVKIVKINSAGGKKSSWSALWGMSAILISARDLSSFSIIGLFDNQFWTD